MPRDLDIPEAFDVYTLTALGRQEEWEEPKVCAVPLGLQVGGPAMRLPDEYDAS